MTHLFSFLVHHQCCIRHVLVGNHFLHDHPVGNDHDSGYLMILSALKVDKNMNSVVACTVIHLGIPNSIKNETSATIFLKLDTSPTLFVIEVRSSSSPTQSYILVCLCVISIFLKNYNILILLKFSTASTTSAISASSVSLSTGKTSQFQCLLCSLICF